MSVIGITPTIMRDEYKTKRLVRGNDPNQGRAVTELPFDLATPDHRAPFMVGCVYEVMKDEQ